MRLPLTMAFYIARVFFHNVMVVLGVSTVLILLIDSIEIIRSSFNKDVPFWILLQMVLLKFPLVLQKIAPFIILISSMLTFNRLNRSQELVAARAAGVSAWQFLSPAIASAFALGAVMVTTINPIACAMVAKYSQLEGKYMHGQISALAISSSGLWLRQRNNAEQANPAIDKGESIIHALRVGQEDDELYDVTIFVFTNQDKFVQRVDARKAKLANGFWHLSDTVITLPDKPAVRQPEYFLETELTLDQIHNSFAAPETISFWSLPGFINTLQDAGFSALRHRQHWHATLASPIFYAAMVLIAAAFSLQLPRHSKTSLLITSCVITGFIIYFMADIISALGLSGKLPIMLSAWVPVMLTLLAGVAPILHFEDG